MSLLLREHDVRAAVGMTDALETTELALRSLAEGHSTNQPRHRLVMPGGVLHMLAASVPELDVFGFKSYSAFGSQVRFAVWLYRYGSGELLAMVEADWLGRLRTGAASGVATRHLAREDARTLGVFGTGGQAETQVLAVARVRPLDSIAAYSRNSERLQSFCERMSERLGVPVDAAEPAVVAAQDIVCTITTARQPVVQGEWLRPGAHINAAGSNWANRRELDDMAMIRASAIFCDDLAQARLEAGDLLIPAEAGHLDWESVRCLGAAIAGTTAGRTNADQITIFKSLGIGAEDVALAARAYERAGTLGLGEVTQFLE